jgi:hypothetical protein
MRADTESVKIRLIRVIRVLFVKLYLRLSTKYYKTKSLNHVEGFKPDELTFHHVAIYVMA